MSRELICKKLDQVRVAIDELDALVGKSYGEFVGHSVVARAAERNFQLVVDTASDINIHIVDIIHQKTTP